MKNFERSNPYLSLCGLNCLLCPMQLSGHCGGCGFGNQSCPIARCSLEHEKPEYCSECEEYPCSKYDHIDEWDSFVTHQNQKANLERRQRLGTERYNEEQIKRREILDRLLAVYNQSVKERFFRRTKDMLLKTGRLHIRYVNRDDWKSLLAFMDYFQEMMRDNGL